MPLDGIISGGPRSTLKELRWFDILILTIILFGNAIYDSTMGYISLLRGASLNLDVAFNTNFNYQQFIRQSIYLAVAFLYLWIRNFDFSKFKVKMTLRGTIFGVVLFISTSLVLDIMYSIIQQFYQLRLDNLVSDAAQSSGMFSNLDFSLILYSLLNGFYEEVFFIGICLLVKPRYRTLSFIISLFIRFSFHTYQGLVSATLIGFVYGAIFYFVYTRMKNKNLYPFFVSHALADMFGLSIMYYISYIVYNLS